jgi:hypothetical protein
MTRHPKLGAVERRAALLVNFLTSRHLAQNQNQTQQDQRKTPPEVQKDIEDGKAPSANMISCPNCKYYPKDVQQAVNVHENTHLKQIAGMGAVEAAGCSAIKRCRREMELDAYREESKYVNKRLSELNEKGAKGTLSPEDKISLRVLTNMKAHEDNIFKYPRLAAPE